MSFSQTHENRIRNLLGSHERIDQLGDVSRSRMEEDDATSEMTGKHFLLSVCSSSQVLVV